ncbi:MAG TPA: Yip1 family protein [Tenuifilaceae bacterium]|nr:Yip1 family protein [Tenuifilaceae bacterium]HPI44605.1 Yip1 family protein [Tenuifilaceae bacterium]HPN22055.1 Yip1 family protein [Tenuifilaceae bacterium]
MSEQKFDFNQFISDSKETLLNPKSYFATMKLDGGMGEPLIKALIYSVVAGVLYLIWSFLIVGGVAGGMLGSAAGVGAFFFTIIGGIIGVFIAALIILIISSICSGNNDFEANLRVAASLMVMFPIGALASVFMFNFYLGTIVSFLVNLYALYLLYIAVTTALKGKDQTAKIIMLVLAGIMLIFLARNLYRGQFYSRAFNFGSNKYQKELSNFQEQMEAATNEMNAAYAESGDNANESGDEKYAKPEKFPSDALKEVKQYLSKGNPVLSQEKLQRLADVLTELKDYDESQSDEINKVLTSNGYKGTMEYSSDLLAAASGYAAVASLKGLEELKNASEAEKKNAGMFEMDKVLITAASQSISLAKLTEEDLHTVYDNWDLIVEIDKNSKK